MKTASMLPEDTFRLLRWALRLGRKEGIFVSLPNQSIPRFVMVCVSHLAPLMRRMAIVMGEEGFEAITDVALDRDPPVVAMHVTDPKVSMWIGPRDGDSACLRIESGAHLTRAVQEILPYDQVIGGGLVGPLQKYIIQAMEHAVAPIPPI